MDSMDNIFIAVAVSWFATGFALATVLFIMLG
jgi:hypothetical protein